MRCVLGLFEGVVTGAADGYARMAGRPAATLLHLGPGLGNGCQCAQRPQGPHADGEHRRRARELSPAVRNPAAHRHRGHSRRVLGLGAHQHQRRRGTR
ncbi:MAG: thiamine pyrophosphate-binding protein [Burkholderiaceae bacterium]